MKFLTRSLSFITLCTVLESFMFGKMKNVISSSTLKLEMKQDENAGRMSEEGFDGAM